MIDKWSNEGFEACSGKYSPIYGKEVAGLVYVTCLAGSEPELAMHGGGNTSVKTGMSDIFCKEVSALYVKASGRDMADVEPDDFVALDLEYLKKLKSLKNLSDKDMADQFILHYLRPTNALPSIETLIHAFLGAKYIVHTHPEAILALTNREDGNAVIAEASGSAIKSIPYVKSGFDLAIAVSGVYDAYPEAQGIIVSHHGLITWGNSAKEAYDKTVAIVNNARVYASKRIRRSVTLVSVTTVANALSRYAKTAPVIRGALASPTGNPDLPYNRVILRPVINDKILNLLDCKEGKEIAVSSPLTPDYLIRTKSLPLWIDAETFEAGEINDVLTKSIERYALEYREYIKRCGGCDEALNIDNIPRVLLFPGMGAVCAGSSIDEADMIRDITAQALSVKLSIYETGGTYKGLSQEHLFDMEFRSFQRKKLKNSVLTNPGLVVLVTGSAGAIGTGICQSLLEEGYHIVATDLPGDNLDNLVKGLSAMYPGRIMGAPMDVTDPASVASGFAAVVANWGGIDGVIVNAGIAHVSTLETMNIETFRKLERVNIDGALIVISEAARLYRLQKTGGDIILISTKNVFAPGAKFGAYSATKAAAHQLARIASLELADMGVRVNMVAPDAVFSHGEKKSGLWAAVGPDRMRARGLDETGLEEYYRSRNLLKASVTARHVANGVLFFLTHKTPTTGATIPVDGGLPDATPR
jgi:rhamnose utilization protein RhaD (predicted bifunctional aldolase and dehydrogenase)/NAD(P)-dependent dehydrogenase (short-subunit alcohol dehydrogenase family)